MTTKPLLRVTDIMKLQDWGFEKAKRYFNAAKSMDNDPFDLRPFEVPTRLFFEVLNVSLTDYKTQLEVVKLKSTPRKSASKK